MEEPSGTQEITLGFVQVPAHYDYVGRTSRLPEATRFCAAKPVLHRCASFDHYACAAGAKPSWLNMVKRS
jgi:hypothetical protein